jgi:hypothetical protein
MSEEREGPRIADVGQVVPGLGAVQERCETTTYGGYWVCVRHGGLRNNAEMEQHTDPACRIAWWCFGHNALEVP